MFPGEITNLSECQKGDLENKVPDYFNVFTPDVLSKIILKYGFKVKKSDFFSLGWYPEEAYFDGRKEEVYLVAEK